MIVLVFKKKFHLLTKKCQIVLIGRSGDPCKAEKWLSNIVWMTKRKEKVDVLPLITLSVVTFIFLVFRESKVNNDECHPIKPADSLKTATKQQLSGCEASRNTKSCKFNTGFLFFSAFIDSFTFCSSLSTQLRLINTHSCHFELLIRTLHNVKLKAFIVD